MSENLIFKYKNYRGSTEIREVYPVKVFYGKTKQHDTINQHFMRALCVSRQEERDFPLQGIINGYDEEIQSLKEENARLLKAAESWMNDYDALKNKYEFEVLIESEGYEL